MGHPPRIPVWLGWEKPVIYFITICVSDRKAVLANDATFDALKRAAAKLTEWKIFAAILMPDHSCHCGASPRSGGEGREFFRRIETMDSQGAVSVVEMAAGLL